MNIARLKTLRDALIEHAKNPGNLEFDLENWASVPNNHYVNHPTVGATEAVARARRGENFCGTTACALGLATTIPAFQRAGLKDAACPEFTTPDGDFLIGCDAGAAFFDISEQDAIELFIPDSYGASDRKNPLAVAEKITSLLETA